jgi:4a-hydroxytetrahydrobiopterin dehydratase
MADRVSAAEFDARTDLADWRVLVRRIEACFVAPSFEDGAVFVQEIGDAARVADHHPDIALIYPGRVTIALTTHSARGLTQADLDLATTISSLAAGHGFTSEPRSTMRVEVAIDAMDIDAVRPFWAALLGYVDEPPATAGGQIDSILDPGGIGPAFWFQQMDAPRTERNRFHIDVSVPHDAAEDRIAAALAAGGRLVTDRYARAFWVLADPEGNEACICTWQDRG